MPGGERKAAAPVLDVRAGYQEERHLTGHDMDAEALVDRYCMAWSDPDPARRGELLHSVLAEQATYCDPTVKLTGPDELLAHIEKVVAQRPGAKILRISRVDLHHGIARFAWHLVKADGTALPEGLDIVEFTADGKIGRIVGFFGPLRGL